MVFGKFFIPSLIGFNSLTITSFKCCCMCVIGLKSFESSFTSPKRSDKKFCWMFCLGLRNSLTINPLFLGSVIFRNEIFFNYILNSSNMISNAFLNTVLNTVSIMVFNSVSIVIFNTVLNTVFEHGFEYVFK